MDVLPCVHPSFPKTCRTSDGESTRHPSSRKRFPAKYHDQPFVLDPPCSNCPARRPKLPPLNSTDVPGFAKPSLVRIEIAPPSVFNPYSGSDPGISVNSSIAIFGIRSHATTSPNG